MRRREFIAALGGAMAWPVVARPQQSGKMPSVGFVGASTASAWASFTAAFVRRLRDLGRVEGRAATLLKRVDVEWRACWRPFDDEEIVTARADCCRR
jgi:hypothetical protein